MASVCFYFQVHQPFRLRRFSIFDRGADYFDNPVNQELLRKVGTNCYLPANQVLLDLLERCAGRFKVAFSLSGVVIEQFQRFLPEVLDSFHGRLVSWADGVWPAGARGAEHHRRRPQ